MLYRTVVRSFVGANLKLLRCLVPFTYGITVRSTGDDQHLEPPHPKIGAAGKLRGGVRVHFPRLGSGAVPHLPLPRDKEAGPTGEKQCQTHGDKGTLTPLLYKTNDVVRLSCRR